MAKCTAAPVLSPESHMTSATFEWSPMSPRVTGPRAEEYFRAPLRNDMWYWGGRRGRWTRVRDGDTSITPPPHLSLLSILLLPRCVARKVAFMDLINIIPNLLCFLRPRVPQRLEVDPPELTRYLYPLVIEEGDGALLGGRESLLYFTGLEETVGVRTEELESLVVGGSVGG